MTRPTKAALILLAALLLAPAARAKVIFTGYGDMRLNAYTPLKVSGDAAALTAVGLGSFSRTPVTTRGFSLDNVGLFAATTINDNMDFKVDFNYRNIGTTVGQIRLQYAYLEHRLENDWSYRAGKVTLPFGYFNQNRFYSFQRVELQSPIFQSAILGLPIADLGVNAVKRVDAGSVRWILDGYVVNGYGRLPSNPNFFRSPTALGGTNIANNIGATNNNAALAYGGRVVAGNLGGRDMEAGLSYYGGAWDTGGSHYLQMWDAHYHAVFGHLDLLTELLHLDVSGDPGFAAAVDDTHWQTNGYFVTADFPGPSLFGKPLTPYLGSEGYETRGHSKRGSREKLQYYRSGAQLKPLENLALKAEYAYLYYDLPITNTGEVRLWAHQVLAALVLTF